MYCQHILLFFGNIFFIIFNNALVILNIYCSKVICIAHFTLERHKNHFSPSFLQPEPSEKFYSNLYSLSRSVSSVAHYLKTINCSAKLQLPIYLSSRKVMVGRIKRELSSWTRLYNFYFQSYRI
jgi:hypothetical protein